MAIPPHPEPGFAKSCLVLIPALNERECVAETVRQWLEAGFAGVRVIDNGSTDDTAALARAAGADVVSEPVRGYGAAAWRGLQELPAGIGWVLFSSADGSDALDPEECQRWEAVAREADLILGDRSGSAESRAAMNASQRICTAIFRGVARAGWGRTFGDVGSLRAVRVGALSGLGLTDRGFGWNVEMQVRAIEVGLRIAELPVRFRPRRAGASKISGNLRGTLRAAWGILAMMFRLWRTRR
jgi:glycosyltransferase involved in cell wall biosynthesis